MKYIKNGADLRVAYEIIQIYRELGRDLNCQHIIETKQAIRRYSRCGDGLESRVVKDEGIDGYILLQELPRCLKNVEEANLYFEERLKMDGILTSYDCSGAAFTSWYKVFWRNGRFYAYHCVRFDL